MKIGGVLACIDVETCGASAVPGLSDMVKRIINGKNCSEMLDICWKIMYDLANVKILHTIQNEEKGMKKKMCAVCAVIGVMLLGSATAFFTDRGSAFNEFIVGNVSVDLTEPGWNPDEGTALTPNKTVKKDPQVTNTGSNDAFVFLQVKVPTASVKTAAADGSLQDSRKQDLFHYTVNSGWKLVDQSEEADASVYTYAYINADGAMKKLSPQGNTGALFDSVTFLNLVEGQLDRDTKLTIDVDVLAIQTEDLGVSSGVPADVLKLIKTQNS